MAASLKLLPGSAVRWRGRRYLIVDYESLDAIIARQPGKRRLERIPVNEAAPDHASHIVSAWTPDLASVPEAVVEEVNLQCFNSKIKGNPLHTLFGLEFQFLRHGPALLPDGTDPDVGQQTNTDLHRSLLDLRGTRSCAERVLLAFGELRQTNIDLGLAGNACIVANAADPFDTPEQIVIRECINCVNSLAHWQIITESESIKEPRGRSRSQSYSQIALLHSHLFLHDQLTFADISGTDK